MGTHPARIRGSIGELALAILNGTLMLTVYDCSVPSRSCFPYLEYGQATPDTSEPTGNYGKMVNGSPDTIVGLAPVSQMRLLMYPIH